jgi:lysophospholipase L1-like esterase
VYNFIRIHDAKIMFVFCFFILLSFSNQLSNMSMNSRRDFLKTAAMSGAMLSIPGIVASAMSLPQAAKITLQKDDVILFQGDSITDAGRDKNSKTPNTSQMMGGGYVIQAAGELLFKHAGKNLTIYNKGISGNKVYQLAERWDADCIELKPNVLSILIGVNDFWHTQSTTYQGTVKTYEDDYRALLKRTFAALPNVKLIIGEPFAVTGINAVDDSWYPEFNKYREVAKKLADEFKAVFIPYQNVFDEAQKRAPGVYWTNDGVHASLAGAKLMAHAWIEAVK